MGKTVITKDNRFEWDEEKKKELREEYYDYFKKING